MLESYIKRLQTNLGNDYFVCQEEKIDYNTGKDIVLVKNVNSQNFISCIQFGLQLEFYTNKVEETMNKLMIWTWEQNEKKFALDEFPYVRQLMASPINNSNFIQVHENYIGTIVVGVTLLAGFRILDIKEIYIDNELIDPNQLTISYNAITDNQRNNSEELNSTLINESNLQVQVTLPNDAENFVKKVRSIMFGKISKNVDFNLKIVYTDDEEFEIALKKASSSTALQRGALTSTSVTLIH